ncbi:MAG: hypothetical protein ACJ0GJ_00970 [Candidatus Actinomarina sp.]
MKRKVCIHPSNTSLEDEDNTEYIKLKAGVSDVEDIDRAIVAETKLEGETFLTAQLIHDDFDEIKEPENSKEIIDNYFETLFREFETQQKASNSWSSLLYVFSTIESVASTLWLTDRKQSRILEESSLASQTC